MPAASLRIRSLRVPLAIAAALTIGAAENGRAQAIPSTATSEAHREGPLYDELARMDSVLFDALFVTCDADRANVLMTDDVEFYDDRNGVTVGHEVREGSRRIASNCPADNGVQRILLPDSLKVHPINGFGAMQTGVHHFVERGSSKNLIGRFYHIWKRVDNEWKLARIISLHETVDAARAAELRSGR